MIRCVTLVEHQESDNASVLMDRLNKSVKIADSVNDILGDSTQ